VGEKIAGPAPHTPAAQGKCTACHEPHGAAKKNLLKADGAALCRICHETIGKEGDTIHAPVGENDCVSCHDPHGGKAAPALVKTMPALCADCHDLADADLSAKHQGAAMAGARCLSCHTPHASKGAALVAEHAHPGFAEKDCAKCHAAGQPPGAKSLKKPAAALCVTCHEIPKRGAAAGAKGVPAGMAGPGSSRAAGLRVHPPAAKGECVSCHTPHASSRDGLLIASTRQLCVTCHQGVIAQSSRSHGHPPASAGECAKCHEPHESAVPGLLVKPALELCSSCHKALTDRIAAGAPHSPVAKGQCFKCHASHGSDHAGMLVKTVTATCASCHGLSGPRLTNAHKGFSLAGANCVSCHDPHVQPAGKKGLLQPALHAPFARGECAKCHGTATTGALATKVPDLCYSCHATSKGWAKKAVVHAPLQAEAGCVSCHAPHGGPSRPILKSEQTRLCLTCHDKRMIAGKVRHAALDDGCATCHEAHSSDVKKLLNKDVNTLCRSCHEDMSKHFHPTTGGKDPRTGEPLSCVGCHRPHSSDEVHLLTHEPKRALCLQCHDPSVEMMKGKR
jgi:predicted CXXCH cytochrome family protein